MSKHLSELNLSLGYASADDDLVRDFYVPCLSAAARYDRAAGYFRSTLYVLVGLAFSDFAMRGGKMRLVCSPELSAEDIEALKEAYREREVIGARTLKDVRNLLDDAQARPVTEFLATLVACGTLDLRIAYRPSKAGIFHQKLGIFEDSSQERLSFIGSVNETLSAWDPEANSESFEVFQSWRGPEHVERLDRHLQYFERLWAGNAIGVSVKDFPSAAKERLLSASVSAGIDAAAERVRHFVGPKRSSRVETRETVNRGPRELQEHQRAVLGSWRSAGHKGIVAHVTGAGKTVTALSAVREWTQSGQPALIVVPSELLAKQWINEISKELGDLTPSVILAGAGSPRSVWEGVLPDLTRHMTELGPRITVATMQTASKPYFLSRVQGGLHLLIVGDEVHRLGSRGCAPILSLNAGGRLGLSATPERFGDPEGTSRIFEYFGQKLPPPFGIPEAIAAGRLVRYDYEVHKVRLTVEEQERWLELTETIRREYFKLPKAAGGERLQSERFRLLLFRRAAILKQAAGKTPKAVEVLTSTYRDGDRWLVYCDSQDQLGDVLRSLENARLPAFEYHSAMEGARDATLEYFSARGGILVAIRCLDEGVDIPAVNRALILASSSNSREFIQRRGRVLRTSPEKLSAEIHDCVVLPSENAGNEDEASMLKIELKRCAEFAEHARNTSVQMQLKVWARQHGLDDFEMATSDVEDKDDE